MTSEDIVDCNLDLVEANKRYQVITTMADRDRSRSRERDNGAARGVASSCCNLWSRRV